MSLFEKQNHLKMKYGPLYQVSLPEQQLLFICRDSNCHSGPSQELLQRAVADKKFERGGVIKCLYMVSRCHGIASVEFEGA